MKKVFIGLLIVAAGAGAFFVLRKKQKPLIAGEINKEWIVGTWKLDSLQFSKDSGDPINGILVAIDSNLKQYRYEFRKDNSILTSLGDSLTNDSSRYEWSEKNKLVWKDKPAGPAGDSLTVTVLSSDSLVAYDRDSTVLFFTKVK